MQDQVTDSERGGSSLEGSVTKEGSEAKESESEQQSKTAQPKTPVLRKVILHHLEIFGGGRIVFTFNQIGPHQYSQVGEKTPPGTLKRDRPKSSCKTWYDQYSQVCWRVKQHDIVITKSITQKKAYCVVFMCLTIIKDLFAAGLSLQNYRHPSIGLASPWRRGFEIHSFCRSLYRSMFAGGPR